METGLLPWVGVSSHVLVSLLALWAQATPRGGGFHKHEDRMAVGELSVALLKTVRPQSNAADMSFAIEVKRTWKTPWPRPQTFKPAVAFRIDAAGDTNIMEFAEQASYAAGSTVQDWFHRKITSAASLTICTATP